MTDFFRFPHTPHLEWLSEGQPRQDKMLAQKEVDQLLAGEVVVEEKVDGANIGISWNAEGKLQVQSRGNYLEQPFQGQFSRLNEWLMARLPVFQSALPTNVILFGEWCAARHSIAYDLLPDWFLAFDVYDRGYTRFWNSHRRNRLAQSLRLASVPVIQQGHFSVSSLKKLLAGSSSQYRHGGAEGIVIRRDSTQWCEQRAKLVAPDFVQSMGAHWKARAIDWNRLANHAHS